MEEKDACKQLSQIRQQWTTVQERSCSQLVAAATKRGEREKERDRWYLRWKKVLTDSRVKLNQEREKESWEFEKTEIEICDTGEIYDRSMTEEKSTVEEREYNVVREKQERIKSPVIQSISRSNRPAKIDNGPFLMPFFCTTRARGMKINVWSNR